MCLDKKHPSINLYIKNDILSFVVHTPVRGGSLPHYSLSDMLSNKQQRSLFVSESMESAP